MPRKRELSKSFRFSEDELKQVNQMLRDNRKNSLESEVETLLRLLEIGVEYKDKPECEIVERWLCPYCPNPFSVESGERLLSHFANTHLIEEPVKNSLYDLRHVFQVAMRTKKIQKCKFLDMSHFPFRCGKNFPEHLAKIDNVNLCIACQERGLSRNRPESNKGNSLVEPSYMKTLNPDSKLCDCPKLTERNLCSINNQLCYERDCQYYYFYKKGRREQTD